MTRSLAIALLLFAAVFGIALVRYTPPAPRPSSGTPSDQFSAERARESLRAIVDGRSRVIGSEANIEARQKLERALAESGWTTEIQRAVSCTRHASCAPVANIIATRAGREPDAAPVLLMAHYDSVQCSPGGSDDGMGVGAVLEAARALAARPPLRRTVVIVLTDGEEAGLLGADAFVHQHPLAKSIHGAVNIDSRGSSGPSAMFETSPGNAWIIGQLARTAERPVTSSLFYEVYRRMPNDTDFTTVKGHAQGVNFANIAGVEHYHTPLDSFDNASPGTLQHHGDQALAMVRALGDAGPQLDAPRDGAPDAVWFDVLATTIVRWPAPASLGLALLALALTLGWTIRLRAWGAGLAAPIAALAAALAASLLVGMVLKKLGALPVPWVAHPLPALFCMHLTSIAAGLTAARLVGRRSTPQVLWAGTWLTWGVLGVVTAALAPGACFLFVVPTFVAGFLGWLRIDVASLVPAAAAAVLWLPIAILVQDGVGLFVPVLACLSSVMLVTTLPALSGPWSPRFAIGAAAAVAALVVVAAVVPSFSTEVPQRVNVVFRQDFAGGETSPTARAARVYVEAGWGPVPWGKPPEAMVRALGDEGHDATRAATPWTVRAPSAEVPRVALEAPRVTVLSANPSSSGRNVRARIQSARGARTIALDLGVLGARRRIRVTVEGQPAFLRYGAVVLRGVPADGLEVTFDAEDAAPIALTVLDITPGLPPVEVATTAHAVVDARSRDARATQTQDGDVTIAARPFEL